MTNLTAKVVFKQDDISDKEKVDRIKQFQQAFTVAAVGYYSDIIENTHPPPIENPLPMMYTCNIKTVAL